MRSLFFGLTVLLMAAWTAMLLELWSSSSRAERLTEGVDEMAERLDADTNRLETDAANERELRDLARMTGELSSRLRRLYGTIQSWVGPLTTDQESQRRFLAEMLDALTADWNELQRRVSTPSRT